MKVTIESTTKIVEIQTPAGAWIEARVWEGKTETGIPVHVYVTRIAAPTTENLSQFEQELRVCRAPSASLQALPLRMIL
jgi:hypothetical protein